MSAAHELAERGFSVTVIEDRAVPGGKARSIFVPNSGRDGRQDLPAEHGFRFFPGFYRHLPDTMSRIPFQRQAHGVLDNLRDATEAQLARSGAQTPLLIPVRFPRSTSDIAEILRDITRGATGLTPGDIAHFLQRLLVLLTSCDCPTLRGVGAAELVGVFRGRQALACLSTLPRRWPDPIAGGRSSAPDERADGRLHPSSTALRHRDPGTAGGPAARRPDQRRLDRPVAELSPDIGRRIPLRHPRGRHQLLEPAYRLGHRHSARRVSTRPASRLVHRSGAGRAHDPTGHARRQTGRSEPRPLGPAEDAVDERDRVLFAQRCPRGPRPRDLYRLGVVAHLDIPASVLAPAPGQLWRR